MGKETIEWMDLTGEVAKGLLGAKVVAIRGDSKLYAGHVVDVTVHDVTLASGNQRQILAYPNWRYQVAKFNGPTPWTPRMAESRLI